MTDIILTDQLPETPRQLSRAELLECVVLSQRDRYGHFAFSVSSLVEDLERQECRNVGKLVRVIERYMMRGQEIPQIVLDFSTGERALVGSADETISPVRWIAYFNTGLHAIPEDLRISFDRACKKLASDLYERL